MVRSSAELARIEAVTRAIAPLDRTVHLKCREEFGVGRLFINTRTNEQITGGEMPHYGIVGDVYKCATCHFQWRCVACSNGKVLYAMYINEDR